MKLSQVDVTIPFFIRGNGGLKEFREKQVYLFSVGIDMIQSTKLDFYYYYFYPILVMMSGAAHIKPGEGRSGPQRTHEAARLS